MKIIYRISDAGYNKIKPDYIDAYNNLGTVLRFLSDFEMAKKTYEIALQIVPSTTLWFNYGNVIIERRCGRNQNF